jgi:RHS repeat-associated protein
VQRYAYDSFGNMTITTNGNINQPYTYTSREYDTETGMYFYRARYYDPKVGRFVTKDPIGFAGGDVNLFGYTKNNPVNFNDPIGKTPAGNESPEFTVPVPSQSCQGYWEMKGWDRLFNFKCICYWLCKPCNGAVVWSGNYRHLPSTSGNVVYQGGEGLKGGDTCFCRKPSAEENCGECKVK